MDDNKEPQNELHITPDNKDQNEPEYAFIQETIKDKKPSKKTRIRRIFTIGMLGILFGLCASVGFSAIKPWAEDHFQSNKTKVTIPEDEDSTSEEQGDAAQDSQDGAITGATIDQIYEELYKIGKEAAKSTVVVSYTREGETWDQDEADTSNDVSGLIVADNGQDTLILVPAAASMDAASYMVKFYSGGSYSGTLRIQDLHFGYAILAVPNTSIGTSARKTMKVATLGNSNIVRSGDVAIALGSQFGNKDDLGYGVVSSVSDYANTIDGSFDMLTTDIPCAENGTGVLLNMKGEVIGLINSALSDENNKNISNAYAISRVKAMIEMLSNGNAIPYVGIHGIEVTEELSQAQNIPTGIYVTELEKDSAGMAGGIKSGDVINSVNGEQVQSLRSYHNALMKYKVGDKVKIEGQRLGADGYVEIKFTVTLAAQ